LGSLSYSRAPQRALCVLADTDDAAGRTAAAGGIALINSIGNLSGWVGPSVVGWLEDVAGKTGTGLYVVGGLEVLAAALILRFMPGRSMVSSRTPGRI
jgi:hypothetical protein